MKKYNDILKDIADNIRAKNHSDLEWYFTTGDLLINAQIVTSLSGREIARRVAADLCDLRISSRTVLRSWQFAKGLTPGQRSIAIKKNLPMNIVDILITEAYDRKRTKIFDNIKRGNIKAPYASIKVNNLNPGEDEGTGRGGNPVNDNFPFALPLDADDIENKLMALWAKAKKNDRLKVDPDAVDSKELARIMAEVQKRAI